MKKLLTVLSATTILALSANAFAADDSFDTKSSTKDKSNGGYETTSTTSGTSANGTYEKSKSTDDVSVSSKGHVKRKIKSKSVNDAKGLMNKKTDDATVSIDQKDNGGYKKTVNESHTDANGTDTTTKAKTNVDVDAQGNVTATTDKKEVTDPKGMMNKTTSTSHMKTVNGEVVEQKSDSK